MGFLRAKAYTRHNCRYIWKTYVWIWLIKDMSKNSRILVVEDQQPNILVVTMLLEELGYAYEVAKSSREALEKIANETYALVLMDVRMCQAATGSKLPVSYAIWNYGARSAPYQ